MPVCTTVTTRPDDSLLAHVSDPYTAEWNNDMIASRLHATNRREVLGTTNVHAFNWNSKGTLSIPVNWLVSWSYILTAERIRARRAYHRGVTASPLSVLGLSPCSRGTGLATGRMAASENCSIIGIPFRSTYIYDGRCPRRSYVDDQLCLSEFRRLRFWLIERRMLHS